MLDRSNVSVVGRWPAILIVLLVFWGLWTCGAVAQSPEPEPSVTAEPQSISLWSTIAKGGIIGYLIILVSLVAVALIVQNFLLVRRSRIVPGYLAHELGQHIEGKKYVEARQACAENDSFLAAVVGAGLGQVGAMFGFYDMQNAMQEVSEREISKLHRKLEYLAFIASTSPMLGLLGTVTGMIRSFNEIAQTEGAARPSQLAGGISEALVTTCLGLIVAIPTMFFVAFFRRRIDSLVAEAETIVEKLMGRFRKAV